MEEVGVVVGIEREAGTVVGIEEEAGAVVGIEEEAGVVVGIEREAGAVVGIERETGAVVVGRIEKVDVEGGRFLLLKPCTFCWWVSTPSLLLKGFRHIRQGTRPIFAIIAGV